MESSNSNAVAHGIMTQASAENMTKQKTNVYIWDMDETLILLKSLLNGAYASSFNGSKDVQKGIDIGKSWENHILQVCDELFFYEQVSCISCSMLLTFFPFICLHQFAGLSLSIWVTTSNKYVYGN